MPATDSKAGYCGSFYDHTGLTRETLYATAEGIYLLLEQAERYFVKMDGEVCGPRGTLP